MSKSILCPVVVIEDKSRCGSRTWTGCDDQYRSNKRLKDLTPKRWCLAPVLLIEVNKDLFLWGGRRRVHEVYSLGSAAACKQIFTARNIANSAKSPCSKKQQQKTDFPFENWFFHPLYNVLVDLGKSRYAQWLLSHTHTPAELQKYMEICYPPESTQVNIEQLKVPTHKHKHFQTHWTKSPFFPTRQSVITACNSRSSFCSCKTLPTWTHVQLCTCVCTPTCDHLRMRQCYCWNVARPIDWSSEYFLVT